MNASTAHNAGTAPRRGAGRLVILGLLVIFVAGMVGTYYRVGVVSDYDRQYSAILGQQRVLSQQLAKNASEAADGQVQAFDQLLEARDAFARNLTYLSQGNPDTALPPLPEAVGAELESLKEIWQRTEQSATGILEIKGPITTIFKAVYDFETFAAENLLQSDELVNVMVETGASAEQVYVAARQLMLMERISANMRRTLKGGEGAVTAADRFGRDAILFEQVIAGLREGNPKLGIEPITDVEALAILDQLDQALKGQQGTIDAILENSIELFRIQESANTVFQSSDALLAATGALELAYASSVKARILSTTLGNLFAGLALLMLILMGIQMTRDARLGAEEARLRAEEARLREEEAKAREEETKEANSRNQEAILRLLGEISDLADGDLTVNATVTEDFTGAIADAINYAIEEMRGLVANINNTSVQVATAAQRTRKTAIQLSEASGAQASKIEAATDSITEISKAFELVSEQAAESSDVAENSVHIANKGGDVVRKTIAGMGAIRETIQETSKRIKRLGESSQEIGDIVGLIDDIADQTNILALNAAIQASMAGEAGRGFAVVADEVQRLAERSGQATRQIEALVKTIQSDTNDAVISMEKSTAGVVEGAKIAEGAGVALSEIESVSNQLAGLIGDISDASQRQAGQARVISRDMSSIRDVTLSATKGTRETAQSIGELAVLADELRRSVAGFRLPEIASDVSAQAIESQPISEPGAGEPKVVAG